MDIHAHTDTLRIVKRFVFLVTVFASDMNIIKSLIQSTLILLVLM